LSYLLCEAVTKGGVPEDELNNDNQQHLNAGDQPLADESDANQKKPKPPTPYRRYKDLFRALNNTDYRHGGIVVFPDGELKILPREDEKSATESCEFHESAELLEQCFQ